MRDDGGVSTDRVTIAPPDHDPALGLASAPFATWIGTVQVDPAGDAFLLRSTGDEDRIAGHAEHASLAEAALTEAGVDVAPGSGVWLPLAALYPVLEHLPLDEALGVAARMPAPRAERIGTGSSPRPLVLRAARLDAAVGWIGACPSED